LWVEASIASAPSASGDCGQRGVEAEVRAPGAVDDQRHAGGVRHLGAPADVGRHPVVGRRDDERRACVRARASARRAPPGVTPCAIPSSASYSGATKLGRPPDSTRPSIRLACELRWSTTRLPGGASARHSAWLPWVAPLVRNQHVRRPVGLGGERSARSYGVGEGPTSIPSMSCGTSSSSALADRAAQARVGAGAALVPGTWKRVEPRKP
jgi:hypothetical protein